MIVEAYQLASGREPFTEWLLGLKNRLTESRILLRLAQIELTGSVGKHKPVGDGVSELKFDFGPGYRVYFGKDGETLILLLCGGDKDSQARDIDRAKDYWRNYLEAKE
jgi:putative addiction module killer protein